MSRRAIAAASGVAVVRQEQGRLDELEFHERPSLAHAHQVHARVEQSAKAKVIEHSPGERHGVGFGLGERHLLAAIERVAVEGDDVEHRGLGHRVRERPVDEDQRPLALFVHRRDVRLDQHVAAPLVQRRDVTRRALDLVRAVAVGVEGTGAHARFHDEVGVRELRRDADVAEERRHDTVAAHGELAQVVLVARERDRRVRIGETPDALRPAEVFRPARRVVPGRADHDEIEAVPVDLRIIPSREFADDILRREGVKQRARIGVYVLARARDDRHAAHGVNSTVACWARLARGPGHTPNTSVATTPRAITKPVECGTTIRVASRSSSA